MKPSATLPPAERYLICLACPRFRPGLRQCKECGCFMPIKVRIKTATCPLNKWTPHKDTP